MARQLKPEQVKEFERIDETIKEADISLKELRMLRSQKAVEKGNTVGGFSKMWRSGKIDRAKLMLTYKGKKRWNVKEVDSYLINYNIYYSYKYPEVDILIRLLAEHREGNHDEEWFINAVKEECKKLPQHDGQEFKQASLATRMDDVIKTMKKRFGDGFTGTIDNPVSSNKRTSIDAVLEEYPATFWE